MSHLNPVGYMYNLTCLRYDLIDRPGVLGNYVPLNYHCLYDLSVLVEGISQVYTQGRNCPNVKHRCYMILSIKSYLNFEFLWLKPFTFQCFNVLFLPKRVIWQFQIHACSCAIVMNPIVEALYQPGPRAGSTWGWQQLVWFNPVPYCGLYFINPTSFIFEVTRENSSYSNCSYQHFDTVSERVPCFLFCNVLWLTGVRWCHLIK